MSGVTLVQVLPAEDVRCALADLYLQQHLQLCAAQQQAEQQQQQQQHSIELSMDTERASVPAGTCGEQEAAVVPDPSTCAKVHMVPTSPAASSKCAAACAAVSDDEDVLSAGALTSIISSPVDNSTLDQPRRLPSTLSDDSVPIVGTYLPEAVSAMV